MIKVKVTRGFTISAGYIVVTFFTGQLWWCLGSNNIGWILRGNGVEVILSEECFREHFEVV